MTIDALNRAWYKEKTCIESLFSPRKLRRNTLTSRRRPKQLQESLTSFRFGG